MIMLISQKTLEADAKKAGYGDFWEGYVEDKELARCEVCRKWGKFGEDVVGDGIDNYCEAHRPDESNE